MKNPSVVRYSLATLLAGTALGASPSVVLAQDAGSHSKEDVKVFPTKPPTRPMPAAATPRGPSSATRTCTRRSRWTPVPSARVLGPPDAFRFARGEEVTSNTGQPVRLSRPLDFRE